MCVNVLFLLGQLLDYILGNVHSANQHYELIQHKSELLAHCHFTDRLLAILIDRGHQPLLFLCKLHSLGLDRLSLLRGVGLLVSRCLCFLLLLACNVPDLLINLLKAKRKKLQRRIPNR